MSIPARPGVYMLLLYVRKALNLKVGALGFINLGKGFYVYIGSARGPGGLRARVKRHICGPRRLRWHIDYLTSHDDIRSIVVIYAETSHSVEELLALKLLQDKCFELAVRKFGSTDKRSPTHLAKCICDPVNCIRVCSKILEDLKPKILSKAKRMCHITGDMQDNFVKKP